MPATIKIKNSSTAGAAPTASDLVQGELAVNVTDKRLYTENSGGTIVELGTNPSIPVTFPDGSASAPSLTNSGDTNTGMFFPAADTIAFAEGGTEAMRLDSSGNMGLGVTPSAWGTYSGVLDLKGNGSIAAYNQALTLWANAYYNGTNIIYKTSTGAGFYQIAANQHHNWYNAPSGTAGATVTMTQAMTLDASGNLLVGTTSSTKHVLKKDNNNNEATQFDNSNTSSPYVSLFFMSGASPNNSTNYFWSCVDGGITTRATLRSNGGLANYSGNNVNLSDRREKTNFAPAGDYLAKICAIPVQTFNYIDQNLEEDDGLTLGVVAQDVQAVAPELVLESNWAGKDEEPKMRLSIYQTDLQYALMKCIQEQQALITSLTARIEALEQA